MSDGPFCALATPRGSGGINVIRVWGAGALGTVCGLFKPHSSSPLSGKPGTLRYGTLRHEGDLLDEVLVAVSESADEGCAEPVVEVNCHGGVAAAQGVLRALVACGVHCVRADEAVGAYPGGVRPHVISAEAAEALLKVTTTRAARMLVAQSSGVLERHLVGLRAKLLRLAGGEGKSPAGSDAELAQDASVEQIRGALARLVWAAPGAMALVHPRRLVFLGAPNVGKSSLMNALAGADRVVVHHASGTTRDYIEAHVAFDGVPFVIIDCAGIRSGQDQVERDSVARALDVAAGADGVLLVFDMACGWTATEDRLLEHVSGKPVLVVANKSDLCGNGQGRENIATRQSLATATASALSGDGIAELMLKIVSVFHNPPEPDSGPAIFTQRQLDLLRHALTALGREGERPARRALYGASVLDNVVGLHGQRRDPRVGLCNDTGRACV